MPGKGALDSNGVGSFAVCSIEWSGRYSMRKGEKKKEARKEASEQSFFKPNPLFFPTQLLLRLPVLCSFFHTRFRFLPEIIERKVFLLLQLRLHTTSRSFSPTEFSSLLAELFRSILPDPHTNTPISFASFSLLCTRSYCLHLLRNIWIALIPHNSGNEGFKGWIRQVFRRGAGAP